MSREMPRTRCIPSTRHQLCGRKLRDGDVLRAAAWKSSGTHDFTRAGFMTLNFLYFPWLVNLNVVEQAANSQSVPYTWYQVPCISVLQDVFIAYQVPGTQ